VVGDILGLWAGDGGEGAKFWRSVLTEIRDRGVEDVCIVVCDGLKDLPGAIANTPVHAICTAWVPRDFPTRVSRAGS
jgi:transposase-like protein